MSLYQIIDHSEQLVIVIIMYKYDEPLTYWTYMAHVFSSLSIEYMQEAVMHMH